MATTEMYDSFLGYIPAIPEPFWVRHWFFWGRPGCYQCRIKFKTRQEYEWHWIENHLQEGR